MKSVTPFRRDISPPAKLPAPMGTINKRSSGNGPHRSNFEGGFK